MSAQMCIVHNLLRIILSYPDSLVVGAGEQLGAVGGEVDPLDPAQVTSAVSHLLTSLQVPQLQDNHMWTTQLNSIQFRSIINLLYSSVI